MNRHSFLTVLAAAAAAAALAACAEARPTGSAPETDLAVTDEAGASVPGNYELWSPNAKDSCDTAGSGCSVNLPEGDYNLTFTKERSGRMAQSTGGSVGGERGTGCLRARVHLVPGKPISCKKTLEYNCVKAAVETMDCGPASSARYGYRPGQPAAAPAPAD